jgi:hypothetical protein
MEKQLALIKYGKFSYCDTNTMPIYELNWFYDKLVEWTKDQGDTEEMFEG